MPGFLKSFEVPNSWAFEIILVIVGGIFLHYFLPFFDKWRSNRREYADTNYKADLDRLVAEPQQEKIFTNLETRSQLKAIEYSVQLSAVSIIAIFLAVIGYSGWVLFPFMLLFVFFWKGFVSYSRAARRLERLLTEFYSMTPLQNEKEKKM